MKKSIVAENSATLNDQNLLKWLKTKNQCFAVISDLFTERAVRLNFLIFGKDVWEGACPYPDYRNKLTLSPPNTPFLLPVLIVDDTVIISQLLHFRIKMTSFLCF